MDLKALAVGAVPLSCLAGATGATALRFTAILRGADQVAPTTTRDRGAVSATLDTETKGLDCTATYAGLTGPATAAHLHDPRRPARSGRRS